MTHHQLGTLKLIYSSPVGMHQAGGLNMNTLGSLIKRGWIERSRSILLITPAGYEAMQEYAKAKANLRKTPGELTERVAGLLLVHKVVTMRKAG